MDDWYDKEIYACNTEKEIRKRIPFIIPLKYIRINLPKGMKDLYRKKRIFKTLKNKIEDTRTWKKILEHKRASRIPPLKELALWKWLYSTISSLQDQCNFHKNANDVLHRNRKWVLKTQMEVTGRWLSGYWDSHGWKVRTNSHNLSSDHTHILQSHTSTPCKSKKNFRKLMKVQKILGIQSNSDWKTMLGASAYLIFSYNTKT